MKDSLKIPSKPIKSHQKSSKVTKNHQNSSKVTKNHQNPSKPHQKPIKSHQNPSKFINYLYYIIVSSGKLRYTRNVCKVQRNEGAHPWMSSEYAFCLRWKGNKQWGKNEKSWLIHADIMIPVQGRVMIELSRISLSLLTGVDMPVPRMHCQLSSTKTFHIKRLFRRQQNTTRMNDRGKIEKNVHSSPQCQIPETLLVHFVWLIESGQKIRQSSIE